MHKKQKGFYHDIPFHNHNDVVLPNLFAKTFGGTDWDWAYSVSQTTDGGCVVAGETKSFGAGDNDFFVLKLRVDENYPDCVQECLPLVMTASLSISAPSYVSSAKCSPSTSSPSLTVTTPSPSITDACLPIPK